MPQQATVNGLLQDAGPFGFELLEKPLVALGQWDCDGKGDEMSAPPDRLVDTAHGCFVVADTDESELWYIGKPFCPHKPGTDRVAARYLLDFGFGLMVDNLGFLRDGKTHAAQRCQIFRYLVVRACHERGYRRPLRSNPDEDRFLIGAGAVQKA
jgi:hypothetical protein